MSMYMCISEFKGRVYVNFDNFDGKILMWVISLRIKCVEVLCDSVVLFTGNKNKRNDSVCTCVCHVRVCVAFYVCSRVWVVCVA